MCAPLNLRDAGSQYRIALRSYTDPLNPVLLPADTDAGDTYGAYFKHLHAPLSEQIYGEVFTTELSRLGLLAPGRPEEAEGIFDRHRSTYNVRFTFEVRILDRDRKEVWSGPLTGAAEEAL